MQYTFHYPVLTLKITLLPWSNTQARKKRKERGQALNESHLSTLFVHFFTFLGLMLNL